jgi:hypothetical protein
MLNRQPTAGFQAVPKGERFRLPEKMARLDDEHRSVSLEGWDLLLARICASSQIRKSVIIQVCY